MENKNKIWYVVLMIVLLLAAIAEVSFIYFQYSKINYLRKELESVKTELNSTKESLSKAIDELDQEKVKVKEKSTEIEIVKIAEYRSERLGISFEYPKEAKDEEIVILEKDNEILMFIPSEEENQLIVKSLDFKMRKDEKVTDAILRIFSNENENCIVVKKDVSGGIFNEIAYDEKELSGEYDLHSNLGLKDDIGCGDYYCGGHAHFIYNDKFPQKIIFVEYGNYTFLSSYDGGGNIFNDWLNSIKYYK